jgi:hypothetical protein
VRYVYGATGGVAAMVESSGIVTLGTGGGPPIGLVRGDREVFSDEAGGNRIGSVDPDGRIRDEHYQVVGHVDAMGRVLESSGRLVGRAEFPVDGAVLLLLVGVLEPDLLVASTPTPNDTKTIMEETLSLQEEQSVPGVRKNYRKLTDADVFGTPPPKKQF